MYLNDFTITIGLFFDKSVKLEILIYIYRPLLYFILLTKSLISITNVCLSATAVIFAVEGVGNFFNSWATSASERHVVKWESSCKQTTACLVTVPPVNFSLLSLP